eukprot:TRINITY_DN4561_c0_g1_i1.p1 TRINITY_DN4561_c0_g1~~TRINITY_DN4561_c0_g1_i1.p1  ORF type:complete len:329 (-),score=86.81 TRINITY_DN4561_c0_g1_i1:1284-2270(-)
MSVYQPKPDIPDDELVIGGIPEDLEEQRSMLKKSFWLDNQIRSAKHDEHLKEKREIRKKRFYHKLEHDPAFYFNYGNILLTLEKFDEFWEPIKKDFNGYKRHILREQYKENGMSTIYGNRIIEYAIKKFPSLEDKIYTKELESPLYQYFNPFNDVFGSYQRMENARNTGRMLKLIGGLKWGMIPIGLGMVSTMFMKLFGKYKYFGGLGTYAKYLNNRKGLGFVFATLFTVGYFKNEVYANRYALHNMTREPGFLGAKARNILKIDVWSSNSPKRPIEPPYWAFMPTNEWDELLEEFDLDSFRSGAAPFPDVTWNAGELDESLGDLVSV